MGSNRALLAVPHTTPQPPLIPAYTPAPGYPAVKYGHGMTPAPVYYGYSPAPRTHHYQPHYAVPNHHHHYPHSPAPKPAAGAVPYIPKKLPEPDYGPPGCAKNATTSYCLTDYEYPSYDIQHAIEYHYSAVAALYKDVIANTDNSVDRYLDYYSNHRLIRPPWASHGPAKSGLIKHSVFMYVRSKVWID